MLNVFPEVIASETDQDSNPRPSTPDTYPDVLTTRPPQRSHGPVIVDCSGGGLLVGLFLTLRKIDSGVSKNCQKLDI